MDTLESARALVDALRNPAAYFHPVDGIAVLETHISWIVLTGTWAYKIKKPLDLGFLDYSTLERRRNFCHEELRLNRRTAPELYLSVAAITVGANGVRMDGEGEAREYAVKMRQFEPEALLANRLGDPAADHRRVTILMKRIARFHAAAAVAPPDSPYAEPKAILGPMEDNFRTLETLIEDRTLLPTLERQAEWVRERFFALESRLRERSAGGFVRECHGDLHLGNIAVLDGEPIPFDCIEFNPSLRWVDVMSELAFLLMDFEHRGHAPLARFALNQYLEQTGDYEGLQLLAWYLHYRAMVRAKINQLRLAQPSVSATERLQLIEDFGGYMTLAERYAAPPSPYLLITFGLSGSGKSYHAARLTEQLGLVRLRSDVERKRLFGLTAAERSGSPLGGGIYGANAGQRTYVRLAELARSVLAAGYPVVVDATFLSHSHRQLFRTLAAECRVPFAILEFTAPDEVLEARVERRARRARDPSEATVEVLHRQQQTAEPLSETERQRAVTIDTSGEVVVERMAEAVERLVSGG